MIGRHDRSGECGASVPSARGRQDASLPNLSTRMNRRQRLRWRRYLLRTVAYQAPTRAVTFSPGSATDRRQRQLIIRALATGSFGGLALSWQLGYRQFMADQVGARCVPCLPAAGQLPVCYACGHKHPPDTYCPTHTWNDTCPYEGTSCTNVRMEGTP